MRSTIVLALLAAGCGASNDATADLLASLDAAMTNARTEVDRFAADGPSTATIEDFGGVQDAYVTAIQSVLEEAEHTMDELEGCHHDDAGMHAGEAHDGMERMRDAVGALEAAHAAHTDVADCHADATAHVEAMHGELDEMSGHHDGMMEMAQCEEMGGHDDDGDGGH